MCIVAEGKDRRISLPWKLLPVFSSAHPPCSLETSCAKQGSLTPQLKQ